MTIKTIFIPVADYANAIEITAASGVKVKPSVAGSYRAIAGVLEPSTIVVAAPTLVSASITDNATGVSVSASIALTFSENIEFVPAGGVITLRDNDGGFADYEVFDPATDTGTGNGQVSISGNVLTINPTSAMAYSIEHALRIAANCIRSVSSGVNYAGIANDTTLSWTTEAAPGLLTAPTWQALGTFVSQWSDGVGNPAHATNDILVPIATWRADKAPPVTLESAGWAQALAATAEVQNVSYNEAAAWWKRAASGAEADPVMEFISSNISAALIANIRGCKESGAPFVMLGTPQFGIGDVATCPGGDTGGDERLIMHVVARMDDPAANGSLLDTNQFTNGDLTDFTIRHQNHFNVGAGGGIYIATGKRAVQGTIGAASATFLPAITSGRWIGFTLAFIPVGG